MSDEKQPEDQSLAEQAQARARDTAAKIKDFGKKHAPKARALIDRTIAKGKDYIREERKGAQLRSEPIETTPSTPKKNPNDPVPSDYEVIEGARDVLVHPSWCHYRMDNEGVAHLSFRCRRNFYWWAWSVVLVMGPIVSLVFAILAATATSPSFDDPNAPLDAFALVFFGGSAVSVILAIIFFSTSHLRIAITVHKDVIKVDMYTYDRRYFGGLSLGSTISQKQSARIYESIWIRYGQWGYDTPWLMRQEQAVTTMAWVASIIQHIDAASREYKAYEPSLGVRDDGFD